MLSGLLLPALAAGAVWPYAGLAQTTGTADSVRVALPVATVAATRPTYFAAGARLVTIDSAALLPTGTLADALALGTPLYLKQYGPGQLASLSIRGTSARHAAVLWHGFNLNFPSLGESDFALLPTAGFGSATIRFGPAAAQYGSGAVGGAVVLESDTETPTGVRAAAEVVGGSFGYLAQRAEVSVGHGRVSARVVALNRRATNDFSYRTSDRPTAPTVRQTNAAFAQQSLAPELNIRVGAHGTFTTAAWLTRADRQLQPGMTAANVHAREQDDSQRLLIGYADQRATAATGVRLAGLADRIRYGSDLIPLTDGRTRSVQFQAEHTRFWGSRFTAQVGVELQRFAARIAEYGRPITESRAAAFALVRYAPNARLRLTLNVRQAALPGRRPPLAPSLGGEFDVMTTDRHVVTLKGSGARAYRAPTLNERYWLDAGARGNAALLPETSFGGEVGARYATVAPTALTLETELTAYRLRVDDWVQWLPERGSGVYIPQNLRQVLTRGVEATARVGWQHGRYRLTVRTGYAYVRAEKVRGYVTDPDPVGLPLPYVPAHTATAGLNQTWRRWQLSVGATGTSFRYVTASATDFLPGYGLLHASFGREVTAGPWRLTVLVQGFNLANTFYQTYADRAMPGRAGQLTVRAAWR